MRQSSFWFLCFFAHVLYFIPCYFVVKEIEGDGLAQMKLIFPEYVKVVLNYCRGIFPPKNILSMSDVDGKVQVDV